MATRKVESWREVWQAQGYRNPPGGEVTRSADELLQEDKEEARLAEDEVEVYATPSTRVGHHDGHARTSRAEWGRESGILNIFYSHGVRTYPGISEQQWESLKQATSPGRWIDANLPR